MQLLTKKVTDTHKKLTLDLENRENIIFSVAETDKDDEIKTFNQMCIQSLGFRDAPNASMTILGAKTPNLKRPLRMSLQERWDKRKFLAKLYKLKQE